MLTTLLLSAANDSTSIVQTINGTFDHIMTNIKGASAYWDGVFFTNAANQIAAICLLFYIGYEMWPVILGRRSPDVTKLFRPMLLAIVISAWPWFYLEFLSIKTELAEEPKAMYMSTRNQMVAVENRMDKKIEAVDSLTKQLFIMAVTGKMEEDRRNGKGGRSSLHGGEGYNGGGEGGGVRGGGYNPDAGDTEGMVFVDEDHSSSAFWDTAYAVAVMGEYWVLRFVEYLIEIIATLILQCYLCGLIVISEIGIKILGMFGPILFALSIAERFRDYWAKWIEKFCCMALYPFLAYLIMAFMSFIIVHQMEIQEDMITIDNFKNFQAFLSHTYANFGVLINFLTALFVCSACMKAVPELAAMVFPGPSGRVAVEAGQFMTGMTMTIAGTGVSMAAKTAATVVRTGAMAAGAAAGVAMGGIGAAGGVVHDAFNNRGSSDSNKRKSNNKNSMDSYAWYNPLRFFFGRNKPNTSPDGDNFEYKRGEGKRNAKKSGGYSPVNKNVRRGQYIKLDSWASRNIGINKIRQKTNAVTNGAFALANFLLADHNDMAEPQLANAVGNVVSGLKKGTRRALSVAAVLNYHYKKHSGNGTYQAVNRWQKERSSDMVFVQRPGLGSYYYQTYGEEAQNLARLTGEKVKYIKVGNQKVATFSMGKHMLQPVIHRLNEMGLSVNVINVKGKSIYYKEDITPDKQEAIDKVKKILERNGGGMKFNSPMKDFQTEMSGDGYGRKNITSRVVDILGITTDVYGAAFATVKDDAGKTQHIYLDRLLTQDISRLADTLEEWKTKDEKDRNFTTINPVSENELDNAFDEGGFAEREARDYANAASNANAAADAADDDVLNDSKQADSKTTSPDKQKPDRPIDPLEDLKKDWQFIRTTPWGSWKKTVGNAAGVVGGLGLLVLKSNKIGRWMYRRGQGVSSFFGWNDNTSAELHKDIRGALEYKWRFNMAVKNNVDFRHIMKSSPISISLKRNKQKVIRRGRGIVFAGVDYKNRTGLQKMAHYGWRLTKWTVGTTVNTGLYALGVATGRRRLISVTAIGAWGFKTSYNGIRWMARQTTARNAVIAWKREDKHNYVIVNRFGIHGNRFQTFGEDAVAIARILHKERDLRVLKIGQGYSFGSGGFFDRNTVPSLTLTQDDLARLKAVLDRRGLTMDVITTRGRSLLTKNSKLSAALGIQFDPSQATADQQPSGPNDPNDSPSNDGPASPNGSQPQDPDGPSAPYDPDGPATPDQPNGGSYSATDDDDDDDDDDGDDEGNNFTVIGHYQPSTSDDDQDEEPIVLDYSSNNRHKDDETFTLKDRNGKTIYIVTGESLKSCLEKMVEDEYSLKDLDLTNADLRDAKLKKANFSGAILVGANLRGAKLQKADFSNADLTNACLRVANLTKAILYDTILVSADLRDANLKKSNFIWANFRDANLNGADFGEYNGWNQK